jgi:hypothetical protein
MSSRKKLTPEKLVDFLTAALTDDNPCKATLVSLSGRVGTFHKRYFAVKTRFK